MASRYWIKLYLTILDDPKMGRLSDRLFRRSIELFLLAGEINQDGLLPSFDDIWWRLRADPAELEKEMEALQKVKILSQVDGEWYVTKFAERQAAVPARKRMAEYRKRKRNDPDTDPLQDSDDPDTKRNTDTDTDTDTESDRDTDKKKIKSLRHQYENSIGPMTPMMADILDEAYTEYPTDWIILALQEAARYEKRSWAYTEAILKRWKADGFKPKNNNHKRAGSGDDRKATTDKWLQEYTNGNT